MKKIRTRLLLLIFCILTVVIYGTYYYSRGHVRKVELDYESPQLYTLEEVKEAGDLVVKDFKTSKEYTGCKLTRVYYDEELSRESSKYSAGDVIVLRICYKVGLFPPMDKTALSETDCNVILNRSGKDGSWLLRTGEG